MSEFHVIGLVTEKTVRIQPLLAGDLHSFALIIIDQPLNTLPMRLSYEPVYRLKTVVLAFDGSLRLPFQVLR